MGHSHGVASAIDPGGRGRHRRRLLVVLGLSVVTMVVEIVAAVLAGSVALVADAAHMFTDVIAIAAAIAAISLAANITTRRSSYGLYRVEIVAAAANALLLLVVCGGVIWSAIGRLRAPADVTSGWMVGAATLALVVNAIGLRVLRDQHHDSLNVRGVRLELLGDLFGSFAVVIAGLFIAVGGSTRADAVASLVVSALIVPRALGLLRDAAGVLLESAPRHVDVDHVRDHILGTSGVVAVHDLHVWTITSGMPVMSAHVVVADDTMADGRSGQVLDRLQACLGTHFDVRHSTFQIESEGHASHEGLTHP
jgi:cation diffusion facilitator family transporter